MSHPTLVPLFISIYGVPHGATKMVQKCRRTESADILNSSKATAAKSALGLPRQPHITFLTPDSG
jgi:hypothetical protein